MVLKKSKGSLAVTGNTVRRGGRKSAQRTLKAACITKRTENCGDVRVGQWDDFFDGQKSWNGFQPLSLNKKRRWLIPEQMEERCERYREQRSKEKLCDISNAKQHPKRKCSKKQKEAEEYVIEKRAKVIEKTFLSKPNECKAVYHSIGDAHSVRKGKLWKSQRDNRHDGDYDAVYEITSGLPSKAWPLHIKSQWRYNGRHCGDWHQIATQDSYKGKACTKTRRRDLSTKMVAELMDDYDYEDSTYVPVAETPFPDRTDFQNTYQLSDFVIKKQSKPKRRKTDWCMTMLTVESEDDKDWEIFFADSEEHQAETTRKEENTAACGVAQALDGFVEMGISVETSTVTKGYLERLYKKRYSEGRSSPRRFGILLNLCFDERQIIPGKKCFVIAEQISTDIVKNETALNVKLIGNENDVAWLAKHFERSGKRAFQNLIGHDEKIKHVDVPAGIETGQPDVPEFLQNLTKWHPRCFSAREVFNLVALELFFLKRWGGALDDDAEEMCKDIEIVTVQCGICFENLADTTVDAPAMQLYCCLHTFCRDCWVSYLFQMIRGQKQVIMCPELGCKVTVDIVTLLSMLDHRLAQLYLKNAFEHLIARKTDWQWCPGCERLGNCPGYRPLESKLKICDTPVMKCGCYRTWCFDCQESQHWPINCEDMRTYKAIFEEKRARIFTKFGGIRETTVFIQYCPSCHTPIEKSGGCNKLVCICDKTFCWSCGRLECLTVNCYENKLKAITFTSFDDLGEKYTSKAIKKALRFCYLRRQLDVFKKKLRVAKHPTSSDKKDAGNLNIDMISNGISDISNVCAVVENIAATGFTPQSKHYKTRLYRFADWMEFTISNLIKALKKDHIAHANIKDLNDIADGIKQNLIIFIKAQLGKNIK